MPLTKIVNGVVVGLSPQEAAAVQAEWASNAAASAVAKPSDVQAECARRLAAGFDYDFGDARAVHRIGTTKRDMDGWDEVTKLAQALINAGDTTTLITIATDTGVTQVTAMEWNSILLAASAFRQPIWIASFVLQASSPIPQNYSANIHWP